MERLNSFAFIAPAVIILSVLICGFFYSDYSHLSQLISELGESKNPYGLIMNIFGFMIFGISIILFSLAIYKTFPKKKLILIARILLSITGIFIVLLGFFPIDTSTVMHNISALIAFSSAMFCQLIMGAVSFSRDTEDVYYRMSMIVGLISVIVYVLIMVGNEWIYKGLIQRLFVLNFCIWLIISGIYGRRIKETEKKPIEDQNYSLEL